jgi:hypothetical protein
MQKLCCRRPAEPFFPLGVLLPPQHKFRENIRPQGPQCDAVAATAEVASALVARG